MFVKQEGVPVSVDGGINTILIRQKMDFGTKQRVQSAAARITTGMAVGGATQVPLDWGAYQIALLTQNVLGWSGPAFDGVPCDAEHVEQLDPDEPLVEAVLQAINDRNAGRADDEAKNGTPASMRAGAAPSPAP